MHARCFGGARPGDLIKRVLSFTVLLFGQKPVVEKLLCSLSAPSQPHGNMLVITDSWRAIMHVNNLAGLTGTKSFLSVWHLPRPPTVSSLSLFGNLHKYYWSKSFDVFQKFLGVAFIFGGVHFPFLSFPSSNPMLHQMLQVKTTFSSIPSGVRRLSDEPQFLPCQP